MNRDHSVPDTSGVTVVDLLRHGQPDSDGCLAGHFDAPLTEKGWKQLRQMMSKPSDYDRVISSSLKRCQAFATEFSEQHDLPLVIESDFREMFFGDWDGKSYEWLHQHYPCQLGDFWSDPWQHSPPEGETMAAFHQRIISAWQQLLLDYSGEKLLLVCHSGVIRQLLAAILEMDLRKNLAMSRFNIPYGSLTRIEIYRDEQGQQWPRLMFVNGVGAVNDK